MFTDFMGDIADAYDSVDSFFDDLIGETDLVGLVGDIGKSFLGDTSAKGIIDSMDTASPMVDYDDTTGRDSQALEAIKQKTTDSQAISSADANAIENQWIERFRAISKGTVYGQQ